jgi:hypothetical protein
MPYVGADFDDADVGETVTFFFDFTGQLAANETITAVTGGQWVCSVAPDSEVNDLNAANVASGPAQITGNIAGQRFVGMVAGVRYLVQCFVTTNQGNNLEFWSHFFTDQPA